MSQSKQYDANMHRYFRKGNHDEAYGKFVDASKNYFLAATFANDLDHKLTLYDKAEDALNHARVETPKDKDAKELFKKFDKFQKSPEGNRLSYELHTRRAGKRLRDHDIRLAFTELYNAAKHAPTPVLKQAAYAQMALIAKAWPNEAYEPGGEGTKSVNTYFTPEQLMKLADEAGARKKRESSGAKLSPKKEFLKMFENINEVGESMAEFSKPTEAEKDWKMKHRKSRKE